MPLLRGRVVIALASALLVGCQRAPVPARSDRSAPVPTVTVAGTDASSPPGPSAPDELPVPSGVRASRVEPGRYAAVVQQDLTEYLTREVMDSRHSRGALVLELFPDGRAQACTVRERETSSSHSRFAPTYRGQNGQPQVERHRVAFLQAFRGRWRGEDEHAILELWATGRDCSAAVEIPPVPASATLTCVTLTPVGNHDLLPAPALGCRDALPPGSWRDDFGVPFGPEPPTPAAERHERANLWVLLGSGDGFRTRWYQRRRGDETVTVQPAAPAVGDSDLRLPPEEPARPTYERHGQPPR